MSPLSNPDAEQFIAQALQDQRTLKKRLNSIDPSQLVDEVKRAQYFSCRAQNFALINKLENLQMARIALQAQENETAFAEGSQSLQQILDRSSDTVSFLNALDSVVTILIRVGKIFV